VRVGRRAMRVRTGRAFAGRLARRHPGAAMHLAAIARCKLGQRIAEAS